MGGEWIKTAELVLKVLGVIGPLLSVIFGLAWWSLRKAVITQEQFAQYRTEHDTAHDHLEERLNRGENRFTEFEVMLKNLPTKDDVSELRIRMEVLTGEIRVATAVIQRVEHPVRTMIEQALEAQT